MAIALDVAHTFWPLVVGIAGVIGLVVADDRRGVALELRRAAPAVEYRHAIRTALATAIASSIAIAVAIIATGIRFL